MFLGGNGAGKTSVLEAIHVLGRGRSFRTGALDSLTNFSSDSFSIGADCSDARIGVESRLAISKQRSEQISVSRDGRPVVALSELASLLPIQVITPDVGQLVVGGPRVRRQFLDWGLFHVKQDYVSLVRDYSKALKQRNLWLKANSSQKSKVGDPWLHVLVPLGLSIHEARNSYCRKLMPFVRSFLTKLNTDLEIDFQYRSGWTGETAQSFIDCLEQDSSERVKSPQTRLGPHRADLQIIDSGRPSALTLSRGQAKLVAVAMQLGQAALLGNERSERTVVLFDELVSELDRRHVYVVFEVLRSLDCQVMLSAVELSDDLREEHLNQAAMFHVEHGNIRELMS